MRRFTHKFRAKAVEEDGNRFPSTLEWKYFKHLEFLKKSGEVLFFLRQVPFHLPGGIRYFIDFQEFHSNGEVVFTEVKGMMTDMASLKIKQVEDLYPIKIKIIRKGEF